ncbi:MAG: phosphotransferase [Clostridia bacterium]|nr:phosphotransferase [Clostridia bacterium]
MSESFNASNERIEEICREFRVSGELVDVTIITQGHINTTFRVTFENDGYRKSYLLQRVNTYVFKSPMQIMSNINLVTSHIRNKNHGVDKVNVHFHHRKNGDNYYYDADGEFWRMSNYIDSISFDLCNDRRILRGAGYAFGEFQTNLVDFDATTLYETIPDFHNTPKRLEKFFAAVEKDEYGRANEVEAEIEFTRKHAATASKLMAMKDAGELPLRVTHNDTKSNNVLFDRDSGNPITVIDLDTVMPGLVAFDFGDAIRSAGNSAAEDEPDVSRVHLDLDKFTAFAEGFIEATAGYLTEKEIETLPLGAFTLTFEQAVRFLDDYLTGDKYFRTEYEGHNLVRARCQYKLASDILAKMEDMQKIVSDIAKKVLS